MITRSLAVELTPDEVAVKAANLADRLKDARDLENEKKSLAADFKSRAELLDSEIRQLGERVRTRHEYRDVQCKEVRNEVLCTIELVRMDTGEVVETRPMTAKEQTPPLPFGVGSKDEDEATA